ncbi:LamG domain-containing protein [Ekhidna sp.]|uniref:LamG domain-containing protein n=1 Tax=Ekhidna sp. TaxID=2608089 RepID=UPI003BA9C971
MKKSNLLTIVLIAVSFVAISQPTDGLIAHFKGDNNVTDASSNQLNGSRSSGVTFGTDRDGNGNSAFVFNGTTGFLNLDPIVGSMANNTTGTFAFWIKPDDATPSSTQYAVSFGDTNGYRWMAALFYTAADGSSVLRFAARNNSPIQFLIETSNQLSDGTWSHVACVQDGSQAKIYVDGVFVSQTAVGQQSSPGAWFNNLSGIDNSRPGYLNQNNKTQGYFKGSLDDIVFYNRALTGAEIVDIYEQSGSAGGGGGVTPTSVVWEQNGNDIYTDKQVGIGTETPMEKLSLIDGQLFMGQSTTNKLESGRIRFSEFENSYQGSYIHYDGSSNILSLGVHHSNDADPTKDVDAISILRSNGRVGIGTDAPDQQLMVDGHISTSKTYNTKIQFVRHGWSGSHGILFNSYYNSTVNGSLAATGNTFHANSEGSHTTGAGAIMFFSNGGTMDFRISEKSPGADQAIDWGVPKMRIKRNGYVGIGTTEIDAMLTVSGKIHGQEVKVTIDAGTGPDYVFEDDYDLKSLEEVAEYIELENHLPEVPSAKEMEANGVQLGEMNMLLLRKIEEMTLHQIALLERIKKLERALAKQID